MHDKTPEIWLLIPRYDDLGRRFHTLVHAFIEKGDTLSASSLRTAEIEGYLVAYIQDKYPRMREREEIHIQERDFLTFIILHTMGDELLTFLPVVGSMQ